MSEASEALGKGCSSGGEEEAGVMLTVGEGKRSKEEVVLKPAEGDARGRESGGADGANKHGASKDGAAGEAGEAGAAGEGERNKGATTVESKEGTHDGSAKREGTAATGGTDSVGSLMRGLECAAIGYIHSCFPEKRATPRQGALAPAARAKLVLQKAVPAASLTGLDEYSHVWIIFVFSDNVVGKRSGGSSFRACIAPPKLGGKRIGVFATRSPHRPNPIGQTVVRLDRISKDGAGRGVLHLSGIDFVHGTPVLDIKPYVTPYDSLPGADPRVPGWVDSAFEAPKLDVSWDPAATASLEAHIGRCSLYDSPKDVALAVSQTLALNIRSGATRARVIEKGSAADVEGETYSINFDGLRFECMVLDRDTGALRITTVAPSPIKPRGLVFPPPLPTPQQQRQQERQQQRKKERQQQRKGAVSGGGGGGGVSGGKGDAASSASGGEVATKVVPAPGGDAARD